MKDRQSLILIEGLKFKNKRFFFADKIFVNTFKNGKKIMIFQYQ